MEEIQDSDDDREYLSEMRWNDTVDGPRRLFFVKDYSDLDLDLEERDLEDEENEIIDDVTLFTFTNVLWRAQEITMERKIRNGVKGIAQEGTQ